MPELSIIIPWCDRPELRATLQHNIPEFSRPDLEVILVNCGGDQHALATLLCEARVPRLRLASVPDCKFNKPLALNLGAHHAQGTELFVLDADILLPAGTLTGIRASLAPGSFVTVERVVESVSAQRVEGPYIQEIAYKLEFIGPAGRSVLLEMSRTRFTDGSRGAPGLILLARADFLQVNGMNSQLEGWGWEDLDLIARLELGLDLRRLNVGSAIHLTHQVPPQASAKADRASSERLNFSRCLNNYLAGNLLGTYREDVARWADRC